MSAKKKTDLDPGQALAAQIEKRAATLARMTAPDAKATPDRVRQTRRLLKRAQRRLAKFKRSAAAKAAAPAPAPAAATEEPKPDAPAQ